MIEEIGLSWLLGKFSGLMSIRAIHTAQYSSHLSSLAGELDQMYAAPASLPTYQARTNTTIFLSHLKFSFFLSYISHHFFHSVSKLLTYHGQERPAQPSL
jgi:hypothetical protein